ncbi:hypothetical protein ACMXYN_11870 [Neptuniibacter sp. PT8_73]|uniref:DUF7352 domain-containing protein n=1 Tax=unclassified Neptuniibacter TaxID=2630693 RepID=UPI0039F6EDA3
MKAILKYPLELSDKTQTLTLREGFKPVRFEYVISDQSLYLWVEEPLLSSIPSQRYNFKVKRTGEPVNDQFSYLLTALDSFGPEAYHLFMVEEDKATEARHKPPMLSTVQHSIAS